MPGEPSDREPLHEVEPSDPKRQAVVPESLDDETDGSLHQTDEPAREQDEQVHRQVDPAIEKDATGTPPEAPVLDDTKELDPSVAGSPLAGDEAGPQRESNDEVTTGGTPEDGVESEQDQSPTLREQFSSRSRREQIVIGSIGSLIGGAILAGLILLGTWVWHTIQGNESSPKRVSEVQAHRYLGTVDASPDTRADPTVGVYSKPAQFGFEPDFDPTSKLVAIVHDGDALVATCQVNGQAISNGLDYDSVVWVRVETPSGPGFLPNTWFAREKLPRLVDCFVQHSRTQDSSSDSTPPTS